MFPRSDVLRFQVLFRASLLTERCCSMLFVHLRTSFIYADVWVTMRQR